MRTRAKKKRAALFLRVSQQEKSDYERDGLSIAAQRARCMEQAGKFGSVVVDGLAGDEPTMRGGAA